MYYIHMHPRHTAILEQVINEYIHTNHPIGSNYLRHQMTDDMSAATIRNICRELEEEGYLEQPHTSAGRVPTDRGYRYFVDHIRPRRLSAATRNRLRHQVRTGGRRMTSRVLSHYSQLLAISGWLEEDTVQEAGLAQVLHLTAEPEVLQEISHLLRFAEDHLADIADTDPGKVVAYIGEENPFIAARYTSCLIQRVERSEGDVVFMLLGPKRMRYERNIALLENLAQIVMTQRL